MRAAEPLNSTPLVADFNENLNSEWLLFVWNGGSCWKLQVKQAFVENHNSELWFSFITDFLDQPSGVWSATREGKKGGHGQYMSLDTEFIAARKPSPVFHSLPQGVAVPGSGKSQTDRQCSFFCFCFGLKVVGVSNRVPVCSPLPSSATPHGKRNRPLTHAARSAFIRDILLK